MSAGSRDPGIESDLIVHADRKVAIDRLPHRFTTHVRHRQRSEHTRHPLRDVAPKKIRTMSRGWPAFSVGRIRRSETSINRLDNLKQRDLFRRPRQHISATRPALSRNELRPPQVLKDLLQKAIGNSPAAPRSPGRAPARPRRCRRGRRSRRGHSVHGVRGAWRMRKHARRHVSSPPRHPLGRLSNLLTIRSRPGNWRASGRACSAVSPRSLPPRRRRAYGAIALEDPALLLQTRRTREANRRARLLFGDASVGRSRAGDRIGIVGPNGAGKTTLAARR